MENVTAKTYTQFDPSKPLSYKRAVYQDSLDEPTARIARRLRDAIENDDRFAIEAYLEILERR